MTFQNIFKQSIWLCMNIITGFVIYYALPKRRASTNINIIISVICALLVYAHPLPLLYITWKYNLPKMTMTKYILNFIKAKNHDLQSILC